MLKQWNTNIGRLRILGFLEGSSLLLLIFIAMPLKYIYKDDSLVKSIGLIHGVLFILFVIFTLIVSRQYKWKLFQTTWKVLISSFLPFGTFYVDHKILKPISQSKA